MKHRYLVPTVGSPAHIISLFKLSRHICKHGRCKCSHINSYLPLKFWQRSGRWWNM